MQSIFFWNLSGKKKCRAFFFGFLWTLLKVQQSWKQIIWCPQFSQKTNVGIILSTENYPNVLFWENWGHHIICFQDCWTFSRVHKKTKKKPYIFFCQKNFKNNFTCMFIRNSRYIQNIQSIYLHDWKICHTFDFLYWWWHQKSFGICHRFGTSFELYV